MAHFVFNMVNLDDNYESDFVELDCLIIAGGSDYRAYELLRKYRIKGGKIKLIIFIDFFERRTNVSAEILALYEEYNEFAFNFLKVPGSLLNPSECIKSLINFGINLSSYDSIGIDISCFTKPYFYLFIKQIKYFDKHSSIYIFYTEPKSYLFPKGLFSLYQSSLGPLSVIEIPGFTGLELRGQNRILVTLLGFDGDLSKEINFDVSPSETQIINGFPGYSPKFKDISLVCNEKLIQKKDTQVLFCRANNPFETFNLLESIKTDSKLRKEHGNFFMNIAPLGTKPMALGACLFAIHNPDVRIVYPLPENYMKITTDKCSNTWLYEIPIKM